MRLVILSRGPALYSTRRLGLVALARGHQVKVLNPFECALTLAGAAAEVHHAGAALADIDAVILRGGPQSRAHSLAVVRQFELAGVCCLNRSEPTTRAGDKLLALQLLAQRRLPIARTALARTGADVRQAIEWLGGPPCVVKFTHGAQGNGVMLVESVASAESIVGALAVAQRSLMIQEYLPHDSDARLLVVGGRVAAAIRRRARPGDFRANLHQGGVAEPLNPTPEQAALASAAAEALGLELAGVDLLDGPTGPVVLEVNASPGLEGIESASGRNVAGAVIAFLESRVRQRAAASLRVAGAPAPRDREEVAARRSRSSR